MRTNSYLGHNQAQHLSLSVLRYSDCFHDNVGVCPMSSWHSSERSLSQCMCCIDVQLIHHNLRDGDAGTFDLVDTCRCLSCLVLCRMIPIRKLCFRFRSRNPSRFCYANDWDRVWYFCNISELNNALVNTRFLYHQETCSWVTVYQLFILEPYIRGIFSGMLISHYDTYQHSGVVVSPDFTGVINYNSWDAIFHQTQVRKNDSILAQALLLQTVHRTDHWILPLVVHHTTIVPIQLQNGALRSPVLVVSKY